jgi:hypothetical protein
MFYKSTSIRRTAQDWNGYPHVNLNIEFEQARKYLRAVVVYLQGYVLKSCCGRCLLRSLIIMMARAENPAS